MMFMVLLSAIEQNWDLSFLGVKREEFLYVDMPGFEFDSTFY